MSAIAQVKIDVSVSFVRNVVWRLLQVLGLELVFGLEFVRGGGRRRRTALWGSDVPLRGRRDGARFRPSVLHASHAASLAIGSHRHAA